MRTFMEEYRRWMDSPALSEAEWAELNAIADDEKEIRERFFAPLEFGTAGLRGTMKTGLHNMNIHIIRHATQAFADVISAEGEEAKKKGIVIAHDCRLHGREFAEEAAAVMAANGIFVRIFDALRPAIVQDLLCEILIRFRNLTVRIMQKNTFSFRACFSRADRTGNHAPENLCVFRIGVSDKVGNVSCKKRPTVNHRQENAVNPQRRIHSLFNSANRSDKLFQSLCR